MKLGDLCVIKTNFPGADFWLQRKGSIQNVGKPLTEFEKENIGIKVEKTDTLLPKFLYYAMYNLYNKRYWEPLAKGSLALQHITISDVQDIRLG